MDLIERKKAIEAVKEEWDGWSFEYDAETIVSYTCEALERLPSAQPERKKGRWINHRNDNGHNIADCDQCREAMQWFDDDIKPNYCPNCGADMGDKE